MGHSNFLSFQLMYLSNSCALHNSGYSSFSFNAFLINEGVVELMIASFEAIRIINKSEASIRYLH